MLSNLAVWQLVIGALLPPFLAIVQQPKFPGWLRVGLMLVASVLASVVVLATQGKLDLQNWSHTVGLVILGAIAAYHGIWQPSGIAGRIENATVVVKSPATPVGSP